MNLRTRLFAFNDPIQRSRADYYAYPNRACFVATCFELADNTYTLCTVHRRVRKADLVAEAARRIQ